jgi:hypothetical protein
MLDGRMKKYKNEKLGSVDVDEMSFVFVGIETRARIR